MNIALPLQSFISLLEGASIQKTAFICFGNLVFWNGFIWYAFRQREKYEAAKVSQVKSPI
jgi:predicted membrane channel-forming protein YqfA (hemolysin III family)